MSHLKGPKVQKLIHQLRSLMRTWTYLTHHLHRDPYQDNIKKNLVNSFKECIGDDLVKGKACVCNRKTHYKYHEL